MRALAPIASGAIGLVVGMLVAGQVGPSDGGTGVAQQRTNVEARALSSRIAEANDPFSRIHSSGDDPRIVRLFSALREPRLLRKRAAIYAAIQDLDAVDLPKLVERVKTLPEQHTMELIPTLVERWFKIDYGAAEAWVMANRRFAWRVTARWAQMEPEKAIQTAISGKAQWHTGELLYSAVRQLTGYDDAAAFAKVKTLPAGKLRDETLSAILDTWVKKDPAIAYASLLEIGDAATRETARNSVLQEWAAKDPDAALRKLKEIIPNLKAGVLGNTTVTAIADYAAQKDPKAVLDWLAEIPVEFRVAPAIAAARRWAQKEPVAALEWCLQNGVDMARGHRDGPTSWQSSVLGEAMEKGPDAAFAWLEKLPLGDERNRLLEMAVSERLRRIPSSEKSEEADAGLMRIFAQLPEEGQSRMASNIGEKRGRVGDLVDLGIWARSFPEGAVRSDAIAGAMRGAYEQDASRVEALLATAAPGNDRDAALRGLAKLLSRATPTEAATRALEIGNSAVRRQVLEGVIVPWIKRSPAASREWLQTKAAEIPLTWMQVWLREK